MLLLHIMISLIYLTLFVIVLFILSLCIGFAKGKKKDDRINKKFYSIDETFPVLNSIYDSLDQIKAEYQLNNQNATNWIDWPEKDLYGSNSSWQIIPFMAFDIVAEDNCKKYPKLWNFVQSIPNVKIAILSKLGPKMKLNPHRGWASHSNGILRCHFALDIPSDNSCYVSVSDENGEEKQYHNSDKWMVFDDSKLHYAENPTDKDRIVLIIDIERPKHIKPGTSTENDTQELINIISSFKKANHTES